MFQELSGSNIKNFFIFSQKNAFLIIQETKSHKKFLIYQETELSYISGRNFPSSTNVKKPTLKNFLIFREIELSSPKTRNTLNKTPLGENGCLSRPLPLLVAQASSFLIHHPSLTQLVRLPGEAYYLLGSPCETHGTLCHAIDHQVFPSQPLPREAEDFPWGGKYFNYAPLLTQLIYFPPKGIN